MVALGCESLEENKRLLLKAVRFLRTLNFEGWPVGGGMWYQSSELAYAKQGLYGLRYISSSSLPGFFSGLITHGLKLIIPSKWVNC